jgi:ribosome-associated toxin RatA of RatAB toxin-antitoxin module
MYRKSGSFGMAKSYYSTIFEHSADEVWNVIRDFNNYPVWVDGAGESEIESGKSGDSVGAVRNVLYEGRRIRQRLLAMSDVESSQTYEFAGAASVPVQDYRPHCG